MNSTLTSRDIARLALSLTGLPYPKCGLSLTDILSSGLNALHRATFPFCGTIAQSTVAGCTGSGLGPRADPLLSPSMGPDSQLEDL